MSTELIDDLPASVRGEVAAVQHVAGTTRRSPHAEVARAHPARPSAMA
ncbi:hypothetical protein LWC34_51000 [Kibdelosporangium philippinense]|uniref:FXSXX-COOH protein n=1 Tax=Kibdelosporangium philippinense TaxID=211113 RepID=A0ABS8ZWV4_9PSEU|nr:hypothetical protein [Kibdelosporangium philippinense]MCE7011081.1 hypothetical protein [Kibdelosporangium philippinense]